MAEQAFASTARSAALESKFDSLFDSIAKGDLDPKPAAQAPAPQAPAPQDPPAQAAAPDAAPAPAAEGAEPEGPDYVNVEDYLQKAGIEKDSFYNLPVRVKVDGAESDVPFAEVLKSYQLEKHVNAKSIALAEKQRAWEAEQAQAKEAMTQHLTQAQALGNLAHQQLLAEYQGIDWNKLRAENPAEWAVRNQEFNNRAGQIQQHLAQVNAQAEQMRQEAQKQQQTVLEKERERMFDARPEWRDAKNFDAAKAEISAYAKEAGYTPAELSAIYDHRYMQTLHDAARWRALQAAAPARLKQVRATPQVAAPGARVMRDPKQVALTEAKARWKKNPRDQDAAQGVFDQIANSGA